METPSNNATESPSVSNTITAVSRLFSIIESDDHAAGGYRCSRADMLPIACGNAAGEVIYYLDNPSPHNVVWRNGKSTQGVQFETTENGSSVHPFHKQVST